MKKPEHCKIPMEQLPLQQLQRMANFFDHMSGELWKLGEDNAKQLDDANREYLSILDYCGLCLDASGTSLIEKPNS